MVDSVDLRIGLHGLPILDVLRDFILRVWRRSVFKGFRRCMRSTHGVSWVTIPSKDIIAGRVCIEKVVSASFWDWSNGTRLFFWRWPIESREWARDGHPIYVSGTLPNYRRKQAVERDPKIREVVASKLEKIVHRGYIQPGSIQSLISFFTVPKGEADVRVMFDGTRSGLNDAIWAPSFHLPTIESLYLC
jgi:hypothetical protein